MNRPHPSRSLSHPASRIRDELTNSCNTIRRLPTRCPEPAIAVSFLQFDFQLEPTGTADTMIGVQPMPSRFPRFVSIAIVLLFSLSTSFALQSVTSPSLDDLDEYSGDTLIVGHSYLDNQHNILIGRTIVYDPHGDAADGMVTQIFTWLSQDQNDRNVRINRVLLNETLAIESMDGGYGVSGGTRGGYATLAMCPSMATEAFAFPVFHDKRTSTDPWAVNAASELSILPGVFNDIVVPADEGIQMVQAKAAADGDSVLHIAAGRTGTDEPKDIFYIRLAHDPVTSNFTMTNPDGLPELVIPNTGTATNADIAVSPDGERVAISKPLGRYQLGIVDEDQSWDSDLVLFLNENRGLNWDFSLENAINVTQFQGPDLSLLPDTLAADVDTLRQEYENSLFFDEDNMLHAAFAVLPYYHLENLALRYAKIYYWNEIDQDFIQIADGMFWLNNTPPSLDGMVNHPSLYKDPETGYLWCLYQQFGEPGDTLETGEPRDAGANSGRLNADLYVTASPPGEYNGKLWFKGINVSNTRGTTGAIPSGECRSERDASLAINNNGDYLHVSFLLDLDAGNSNEDGEGDVTNNPIVYLRLSKQELIDRFNEQQLFIPNYPLHVDSTGFWQDPLNWEWRNLSAVDDETSSTLPVGYALEAVYPNPFNSTARIRFQLAGQTAVQLRVYDILGREVATLLHRTMQGGRHEIAFHADGFASGVYFVELSTPTGRSVQKVAVMR